jgi:NADH-quinone oxidoreductase subunit C
MSGTPNTPLFDRRQDAWPSIAAPTVPVPGKDMKAPPAEAYPPIAAVLAKFGAEGFKTEEYAGQFRLIVPKAKLLDVLTFLKDDPEQAFDFLMDVVGVDYLHFRGARDRYGIIYALLSHRTNKRLWVKVMLNDGDLKLPSVYPLWNGADWLEREVFDMFGVEFESHPDLRRILLPKEFADHPLRKDYPLTGKGERHDFITVDTTSA